MAHYTKGHTKQKGILHQRAYATKDHTSPKDILYKGAYLPNGLNNVAPFSKFFIGFG
jgi:hypothetical protein